MHVRLGQSRTARTLTMFAMSRVPLLVAFIVVLVFASTITHANTSRGKPTQSSGSDDDEFDAPSPRAPPPSSKRVESAATTPTTEESKGSGSGGVHVSSSSAAGMSFVIECSVSRGDVVEDAEWNVLGEVHYHPPKLSSRTSSTSGWEKILAAMTVEALEVDDYRMCPTNCNARA